MSTLDRATLHAAFVILRTWKSMGGVVGGARGSNHSFDVHNSGGGSRGRSCRQQLTIALLVFLTLPTTKRLFPPQTARHRAPQRASFNDVSASTPACKQIFNTALPSIFVSPTSRANSASSPMVCSTPPSSAAPSTMGLACRASNVT